MYISLAENLAKGFRRWSDAHQRCGNDNDSEVARVDALAATDLGMLPMPEFGKRLGKTGSTLVISPSDAGDHARLRGLIDRLPPKPRATR